MLKYANGHTFATDGEAMISSGDKTVKYDMLASMYSAVIMGTEMNIDRERFLSGFFSSSVM